MVQINSINTDFFLKVHSLEGAIGFSILDSSGHETEVCSLDLAGLKIVSQLVALELDRLAPKECKFCGYMKKHKRHTFQDVGGSAFYECLGY